MNFCVIVIDENGVAKKCLGPGTWEQAIEQGLPLVHAEMLSYGNNQADIDDEDFSSWHEDGQFAFTEEGTGAGGVYVICIEDFS